MTLAIAIGVPLVFVLFLFGCQRRMIYIPRHYQPTYQAGLPPGTLEIEATTGQGQQVSFYVPPRDGSG